MKVAHDAIITEKNAFAEAEKLVRSKDATPEQIDAAAGVLAQSPDWKQRVLAREIRAGRFARTGAELITEESLAQVRADLDRYPACSQDDEQGFRPEWRLWKRDLALAVGFILGFCAVVRWWPQ